eukprot:181739-Chlamydomonas_euryale.AAC.2
MCARNERGLEPKLPGALWTTHMDSAMDSVIVRVCQLAAATAGRSDHIFRTHFVTINATKTVQGDCNACALLKLPCTASQGQACDDDIAACKF